MGVRRNATSNSGTMRPEPTMLETQLDSIALSLAKMKSRLNQVDLVDHLTDAERAELQTALHRVENRVSEVGGLIRRAATPVH